MDLVEYRQQKKTVAVFHTLNAILHILQILKKKKKSGKKFARCYCCLYSNRTL